MDVYGERASECSRLWLSWNGLKPTTCYIHWLNEFYHTCQTKAVTFLCPHANHHSVRWQAKLTASLTSLYSQENPYEPDCPLPQAYPYEPDCPLPQAYPYEPDCPLPQADPYEPIVPFHKQHQLPPLQAANGRI